MTKISKQEIDVPIVVEQKLSYVSIILIKKIPNFWHRRMMTRMNLRYSLFKALL